MHMADALLSPSVGAAFWTASLGAIGYASRKLKQGFEDRALPLMGVFGAFIFAAQMINFSIPGTGSSGHIAGGMLLAILLGPHAGFLAMSSVLTVQALLFADGGLLALGCNIWNLGAYPCFIAYPLIYIPIAGTDPGRKRMLIASIASSVASLQLGAFSVVMQTMLSGRSELGFIPFALLMQPLHLIIGIVEGVITAGVIVYVRGARPDALIQHSGISRPHREKVLLSFIFAVLITAGVLSWFASTKPDALEWSVEKIYGKTEITPKEGVTTIFKSIQEKTSVMPDYGFDKRGAEQSGHIPSWPSPSAGTTVSGITGSLAVLGLILIVALAARVFKHMRFKGTDRKCH